MSISINVFYVRRPQHPRSFLSCFYKKYLTQFGFGWFAKAPPTPYTTLAVHQKPDLSLKLYYSRELNWTGFYHLETSLRSYCWPVGPDPTHLIKTLLLLFYYYIFSSAPSNMPGRCVTLSGRKRPGTSLWGSVLTTVAEQPSL